MDWMDWIGLDGWMDPTQTVSPIRAPAVLTMGTLCSGQQYCIPKNINFLMIKYGIYRKASFKTDDWMIQWVIR